MAEFGGSLRAARSWLWHILDTNKPKQPKPKPEPQPLNYSLKILTDIGFHLGTGILDCHNCQSLVRSGSACPNRGVRILLLRLFAGHMHRHVMYDILELRTNQHEAHDLGCKSHLSKTSTQPHAKPSSVLALCYGLVPALILLWWKCLRPVSSAAFEHTLAAVWALTSMHFSGGSLQWL